MNNPDTDTPRRSFPSERTVRLCIFGIFVILAIAAMRMAQGFVLPVALAFLLALVLSPVVRSMRRRGLPEGPSAVLLVGALTLGMAATIHTLSAPVATLIDDAPRIRFELQQKLEAVRAPLEAVKEAQKQVDQATGNGADPAIQEVVVKDPGIFNRAVKGIPRMAASAVLTLVLLLFLLAAGDLIYEKIVRSMPTVRDKKRWLRIVFDVEREVSRYLFTVFVINIGLGLCVGLGLWLVGLPNPLLWGVLTALLNFIPYLGALATILAVAVVSLVHFADFGTALIAPGVVIALCTLEGQFVTPTLVGRRLRINAIAVFLAIAFWGWMWGVVGALMAVPLLITLKVFCQHADGLEGLEEFLSSRRGKSKDEPLNQQSAEALTDGN